VLIIKDDCLKVQCDEFKIIQEDNMNWLTNTLGSSIGKKLMMAITGLFFIGFLMAHLAGNLTIYGGKDAFNTYAQSLHKLGPLLKVTEMVLLVFAIVHVVTGIWLFYQNYNARPQKYAVKKSGGGRTVGSRTMPYTGLFLLLFVILHLSNFTFTDKSQATIYEIVCNTFTNPFYVIFYIFAMAVAAIHVSHGFWSAFQSLGLNHSKYMPIIMVLSIVFAVVVGVGFGFLPIYISFQA
jgi:succinate dehydrogenase / fumarate reductase, cytochrome b subunit